MIIPIKCFTCGKVLADKYRYYLEQVRIIKMSNSENDNDDITDEVVYLTQTHSEKSPEGKVLDSLGLNKICCRRHLLTHVDID
jgi:DNA-directed RNA polymerase I, II, and III subunit RPABC5